MVLRSAVNHADGGSVRLDATITYTDTNHEVGVYAHEHAELGENENFVRVYSPTAEDECYVSYEEDGDGVTIDPINGCSVDGETIAWWHMTCGRVLGVYDGRLIEYEPSTLAPLGLVVGQDELEGKRVVVVGSSAPDNCKVDTAPTSSNIGMEGADCADYEVEEQAVLLVDDKSGMVTVVQPNEDGSYWRKIVRNKMIRMKEKRRLQAAEAFLSEELSPDVEMTELEGRVVSSWGPYTSIVGTAVKTGVAGLTAEAKVTAKQSWQKMAPDSKADLRSAFASEIVEAFKAVDTDGSGTLSREEITTAVRKLDPNVTDDEVSNMLSVADLSADGEVTLQEFVMMTLFNPVAK